MMMMMMMMIIIIIIPTRFLLVMVNWALYQGPWEHDPTSSEARETLNHFTGRRLSKFWLFIVSKARREFLT